MSVSKKGQKFEQLGHPQKSKKKGTQNTCKNPVLAWSWLALMSRMILWFLICCDLCWTSPTPPPIHPRDAAMPLSRAPDPACKPQPLRAGGGPGVDLRFRAAHGHRPADPWQEEAPARAGVQLASPAATQTRCSVPERNALKYNLQEFNFLSEGLQFRFI